MCKRPHRPTCPTFTLVAKIALQDKVWAQTVFSTSMDILNRCVKALVWEVAHSRSLAPMVAVLSSQTRNNCWPNFIAAALLLLITWLSSPARCGKLQEVIASEQEIASCSFLTLP